MSPRRTIASAPTAAPERLHFSGDREADELLARDPLALLIGFVLDQQVPMPKAFAGPRELERRLGDLDAGRIAGLELAELDRAFRERPAIHRFPGSMAARVQELCRVIVSEYGGRAEHVWTEASSSDDLRRRIAALPGFGEMKIRALASVLAKRLGVRAAEPLVPAYPTPGDIDSDEARERYQQAKREHKARLRSSRA
ncbi:MAG: DNA repair protein [Thermoleophilia bacterium]|nr:DNA repair protein [Thermoleophilia bacterium]